MKMDTCNIMTPLRQLAMRYLMHRRGQRNNFHRPLVEQTLLLVREIETSLGRLPKVADLNADNYEWLQASWRERNLSQARQLAAIYRALWRFAAETEDEDFLSSPYCVAAFRGTSIAERLQAFKFMTGGAL